jgi:Site-specific recombinase XerD
MVSPFTVIRRVYPNGKVVFSARFLNPDGTVIRTLVLPKATTRKKAIVEAERVYKEGIVSQEDNPLVLNFIADFWQEDSLYIRSRARQGTEISSRYIEQSAKTAKQRFGKILKGKRMKDLSVLHIEKAIDAMEREGLSRRTINIAVQTVRVPVAWWARMHNVPNPLANMGKLKENSKTRGVLSFTEVGALIALDGESPRFKAAVLLGALCGLRLGEVRGLLWEDIDFENKLIHVKHNIPSGDTELKAPKSGSARIVPAPQAVIDALQMIQAMPDSNSKFVIYNKKSKDRPATIAAIRHAYSMMLARIGITKNQQAQRNLVFHGLRHSFVSLSRAAGIPDFLVQRLAGHKTAAMMENYSHSENVIDFSKAAEGMAKILENATTEAKKIAARSRAL